MEDKMKYPLSVISILVQNHEGVLARISSMFMRRNFNIDSISASATMDPEITRITITVHEDEDVLNQILLQTARLEEVLKVFLVGKDSLSRELLLIKIAAGAEDRATLHETASIYKAHILDLSPRTMVLELTGSPSKIDAFLNMLSDYTVLEMCRTGITAMERGDLSDNMKL